MSAPSINDLVDSAEWHLVDLAGQGQPRIRKWIEDKLLPFLRGFQASHYELTMTDLDFGEELARRDRLVTSLVMEVDPMLPPMTFDASCDHLRSLILDWPRRIAFERSQVKRETLRQAAKDMEPTEGEILNLRAEVDELRAQVAARDEALRLIQAALGEVGKSS